MTASDDHNPLRPSSTLVSGRVRLALLALTGCFIPTLALVVRSDQVRCALPAVRQTSRCVTERRNGRHAGRGAVSIGRKLSPVDLLLLRLVAGLGDRCRWRRAT